MVSDKGVLKKQYFSYIIPSVVSQVVYTAYVMVDGIFVARGVSETALAGINVAAPYLTLLWALSLVFAAGTSTVAARLMGEGRIDEAGRVFSRNMTAMAILGVLISVVVSLAMDPLCRLLGATEANGDYVRTYIQTLAPFALFFIASYTLEILTATDGYPTLATITVSIGVVANVVLDYLFIIVLKRGVWGAAIATAIAQVLVIIVYMIHFLGPGARIRFCRFVDRTALQEISGEGATRVWDPRLTDMGHSDGRAAEAFWLTVRKELVKVESSLKRGVPSGINEMAPGFITLIYVHAIGLCLNEQGLVTFSAINYIASLMIFMAVGIAQGSQPLMSFYNGSGDKSAIRKLLAYELKTAAALEAAGFIVICILRTPLVGIFITSDPGLIAYSSEAMKPFAAACLLTGFNVVFTGYFTSLEKPLQGAVISIARCTVMLIAGIALAVMLLGPNGIWYGMAIGELLTLAVSLCLYSRMPAHK